MNRKCVGLVGISLLVLSTSQAQDAKFEKVRDVSPDGKFGVRISCNSEPADPNDIDPNLITAVQLVSLPSKKIVINLPQGEGGFGRVIWSKDSKWFAFPLSEGPRVIYIRVYHRSGDDFTRLETEEEVRIDAKGDVRTKYVDPIRWLKPGVLLLEQFDIFRGGNGKDAAYRSDRFTAKFDGKTGKFRIISKKKLPSKE